MTKRFTLFSLYSLFFIFSQAQNIVYLNEKSEFTKKPNEAIGFAEIAEEGELKIVKFFTLDSILTRISQYSQFEKTPEKQILHGKTTYKFYNSLQDSLECTYNKNMRLGAATFYYPDGKTHVNCAYKQGTLDGLLIQYHPNGNIKRKDIYKKGVATATTIYSEEGELLGNSPFYVAPTSTMGVQTTLQLLSKEVKFPYHQLKKEGVWEIYIEANFDKKGEYKGSRILQTNHKGLIEPTLKAANTVFQSIEFQPALMDNQPVSGSLIFPLTYRIEKTIQKGKRIENLEELLK
ncbi:MAG: hypothetical protein IKY99_01870 [Bacteroidaceae bacterium]|nr:hypothetical protein [Bacteroidaceae bacterium]